MSDTIAQLHRQRRNTRWRSPAGENALDYERLDAALNIRCQPLRRWRL